MTDSKSPILVGLRVDVDTFRGTREGVPRLLELLGAAGVNASFFFTLGPDNMGRHLWRLLRPDFLIKVLRSKAASLYGWDILLRGTLWPGPQIGAQLGELMRATANAGHEVGLHAWDHHAWQMRIDHLSEAALRQAIAQGMQALTTILGQLPDCSAVAGWKCDDRVLRIKETYGFVYNSDCRGQSIFRPLLDDGAPGIPQIPVTLPTYDEIIGRDGIDDRNYNEHLLTLLRPGALNVLTIHAEVEGMARAELFSEFLRLVSLRNIQLLPLRALLPADLTQLPVLPITAAPIAGREGWVAWQAGATPHV